MKCSKGVASKIKMKIVIKLLVQYVKFPSGFPARPFSVYFGPGRERKYHKRSSLCHKQSGILLASYIKVLLSSVIITRVYALPVLIGNKLNEEKDKCS